MLSNNPLQSQFHQTSGMDQNQSHLGNYKDLDILTEHEQQNMINIQQQRVNSVQRMKELSALLDEAVRAGDSEKIQNCLEEAGEGAFPKKELNRLLLQVVQHCNSLNKEGVIDSIRSLLTAGANVDAEDPNDGKTALMISCEKGYIEVVDCLLESEAQVNLKDKKQRSPMLHAIEAAGENTDVVMQLIKKNADVNATSIDGWSPLLKATHKQYHRIMQKLIEKGANVQGGKLITQSTALHLACENGDLEGVRLLVEHGAEIQAMNKEKETPLAIAQKFMNQRTAYHEIYLYLTEVANEKEIRAQQVKDDLVRQAEQEQEKEKKKSKNKKEQIFKSLKDEDLSSEIKDDEECKSPSEINKNEEIESTRKQSNVGKNSEALGQSPTMMQEGFNPLGQEWIQSNTSGKGRQQNLGMSPQDMKNIQSGYNNQGKRNGYQKNNSNLAINQMEGGDLMNQRQNNSNQKQNKHMQHQTSQQFPQQQQQLMNNQPNFYGQAPQQQNQQNRYNQNMKSNKSMQYNNQQQQLSPSMIPQNRIHNQQPPPFITPNQQTLMPQMPIGMPPHGQLPPNIMTGGPQQQPNKQLLNMGQPNPLPQLPMQGILPGPNTQTQQPPPPLNLPIPTQPQIQPLPTQQAIPQRMMQQKSGPIYEEIDLTDEKSQKIFILEQKLYNTQRKLSQKENEYQTLYLRSNQQEIEIQNSRKSLEKADFEIYQLRNEITQLQADNAQKFTTIQTLQQTLTNMKQMDEIEIDGLKNMKVQLEVVMLKLLSNQSKILKDISDKSKNNQSFSEQEILDISNQLQDAQKSLNQCLVTDESKGLSKSQNTQSTTVATFKDPSQNHLIKMIERYEHLYQPTPNDHVELSNKLHEEILLFRDSVKEILNEMAPVKDQLIKNISTIIKKAVANSDIKVYGSHATQLCLPWSDIDIVLIAPKSENSSSYAARLQYLSVISRELQNDTQKSWIKSVNFVENATVPVIKVVCQIDLNNPQFSNLQAGMSRYKQFLEQPFNIDITQMTDHHNGLECVKLVQEYLQDNEVIEPLMLVLKQYLKVCSFNDPYFGGLSSYALFLMLTSFLQSRQYMKEISKVNLGNILLNFLYFYGNFDQDNNGIHTQLLGKPSEKQNYYQLLPFMLNNCVQIDDPLNSHNNVGKSSFKFQDIKWSFNFSYQVSFIGCFCDCHNDRIHIEKARASIKDQLLNSATATGVLQENRRKCDSVLGRIIYAFNQYTSHNA